MTQKAVLAYSGGLDTSVAIKWLKDKFDLEIIALTVDVGNERDFSTIRNKALKVGATKALVKDVRQTFIKDFIFPALQANALYEGRYPLATALSRPLIARLLVEVAQEEGASIIAHGCTGKGNDQVRIEVGINALAPDIKIMAPAREWGMTREETIDYANQYKIPVPITVASPYSIDENLWGRSIECGVLEDPWVEPPEDTYSWTVPIDKTPDKAAYIEIGFEKGLPLSMNGHRMGGIGLIQRLNELAGNHGIGRIDMVENRLVGIKSREIYEAPAALALIEAHHALESMTLSKAQLRFKERVSLEYSDIVYNGLWFSAQHQDLSAYIQSTQRYVSGTVRLKFFKGNCSVVGRKSPFSLYSHSLATYDKGDLFDQSAAAGFIHLWGLPVRTQALLQQQSEEEQSEGS
ncbi:argininosuccinate synthase [Chloroflexota bacterium]